MFWDLLPQAWNGWLQNQQIKTVSEQSLSIQLRWLILTDNEIEVLPSSLSERHDTETGIRQQDPSVLPSMENLSKPWASSSVCKPTDWIPRVPYQATKKLAWLAFWVAVLPTPKRQISVRASSQCYSLVKFLGKVRLGNSHANFWLNRDFLEFPQSGG